MRVEYMGFVLLLYTLQHIGCSTWHQLVLIEVPVASFAHMRYAMKLLLLSC